ncbi:hypothetical protein B0H13DRAFT_1880530 [Mycena leptocephala]|nr:hypothetical protein B0H13DRAFT_1880530 [Mycena leptocephala]
MPRKPRDLPDFFEQDSLTKKVRCLICKEEDPENFGSWILKNSLSGHLASDIHSAHVQNKERRQQELEENTRKLHDVYSGPEASLSEPVDPGPYSPLPAMFDDEYSRPHSPTYANYASAGLAPPIIPTSMTVHDPDEERNRLRAEVERMLSQSDQHEDDDDITLPQGVTREDIDNGEEELDDDLAYTQGPVDNAYFPYANKITMLLDILDNLPRLRMSSNQFKMILWTLKECNVSNVPSYDAFRKMQERLRKLCGSEPKLYTSSVGNRFYVNDIRDTTCFTLGRNVVDSDYFIPFNSKEFQSDLSTLIGNVLDAFGDQDPAKILLKIKLHLLPHIVEDAARFGPPIRNATEVFECFNAIFRLCSILSNHQAPSRDIALKFASMDRMKHILSGGYWKVDDDWICAGPNVLSVLKKKPIIQRHLGWVPPRTLVGGHMRLVAKAKASFIGWKDTHACSFMKYEPILAFGSWVFARDSENKVVVGRIRELLVPEKCPEGVPSGLVTLERFLVSEMLHPEFGMPALQRPADINLHGITVVATAIMFRFSAEHDCRLVKCAPTALRRVMQERQETSQSIKLLAHGDDNHFVINMAGIHNATLVRRNLPVALTVPRPLYLDREAHHHQVAVGLRVAQTLKRARTQEKRRATMKAKQLAKAGTGTDGSDEEDEENDSDARKC